MVVVVVVVVVMVVIVLVVDSHSNFNLDQVVDSPKTMVVSSKNVTPNVPDCWK